MKHRVVIPDESKLRTRSRHSIAFFVHPDDNTVVDPAMFLPPSPAENVEEHRHITLMTAYQHLQQRLRQSYDKRNLTTYSKHDAYRLPIQHVLSGSRCIQELLNVNLN
ncbi:hypothetical protein J6590_075637 [Homalodisca vitripennis]|nr:hypothetical protein J6590_075637 [Homalodisca vitripennis]